LVDPHRPNDSAPPARHDAGIARRDAGGGLSPWVTFALALFASVAIHVPAIQGVAKLGEWGRALDLLSRSEPPPPIEIEIQDTPAEPPEEEPEVELPRAPAEEEARVARREEPEPPTPAPPPPREERVEEIVEQQPPPPVEAPLAVRQRSQNPDAVPDRARFIAEENNRVEEETVARVRNDEVDSQDVQTGAGQPTEELYDGNAAATEVAEGPEREEETRAPETREMVTIREEPPPNPERARRRLERQAGTEQRRQAPSSAPTEVHDSDGSLAVAVREAITIGPASDGSPPSPEGLGGRDQRGTARRSRTGAATGVGARAPDLDVSWEEFEESIGRRELEEEHEHWMAARRTRIRGSNREREWRQFRAAIENYVPNVRPGNQTSLNAVASPFANYISDVHRQIHREFAHNFLAGLPLGGDSPFSDASLYTKLEIILNRDGSVHRVGVVRASGLLPYDLGAFRSVMRAQPYPAPPAAILSGDGRVYLHWSFHRVSPLCATTNAEPYILQSPPGSSVERDPISDEPSRRRVIPLDAVPDWGVGGGERPAAPPRQRSPSQQPERSAPPPRTPRSPDADGASLG
jgi:hypothetical protein